MKIKITISIHDIYINIDVPDNILYDIDKAEDYLYNVAYRYIVNMAENGNLILNLDY